MHTADPEVQKSLRRTWQPYFILQGNICALLAPRDHVNVLGDDDGESVRRAYSPAKLARPTALEDAVDPNIVFHLNQKIP